jgi:hypothetical protein
VPGHVSREAVKRVTSPLIPTALLLIQYADTICCATMLFYALHWR